MAASKASLPAGWSWGVSQCWLKPRHCQPHFLCQPENTVGRLQQYAAFKSWLQADMLSHTLTHRGQEHKQPCTEDLNSPVDYHMKERSGLCVHTRGQVEEITAAERGDEWWATQRDWSLPRGAEVIGSLELCLWHLQLRMKSRRTTCTARAGLTVLLYITGGGLKSTGHHTFLFLFKDRFKPLHTMAC